MNKNYKFGKGDATIINDLDIKTKIIDYLFNSIELYKFRYKMLDNLQQLEFLKDNTHYVSPNFKGYNYFLIFMKIDNSSYCLAIDKKKITYQKNKLNVNMTKIIRLNIKTTNTLFRGSIFDCKFINNNTMIIKDCYKLMGNSLLQMEIKDKLLYLNNIVNNQIHNNPYFDIKFNKLYEYTELNNLIKNIIPKCKYNIQGLVFFPLYSGITIIYTNNTNKNNKPLLENNDNVENVTYNLITDIKNILKNRKYYYEKEGEKKTLLIERTDISDVYNVFENDIRLGIAHIPNMKTSEYCRNNLAEGNSKKFYCIFNNKYKKWLPLSIC